MDGNGLVRSPHQTSERVPGGGDPGATGADRLPAAAQEAEGPRRHARAGPAVSVLSVRRGGSRDGRLAGGPLGTLRELFPGAAWGANRATRCLRDRPARTWTSRTPPAAPPASS